MEISRKILQKVANEGSREASISLSKLAKTEVRVVTSTSENIPYNFVDKFFKQQEGVSVIVCSQIIGEKGVVFLIMSKDNAIALINLLAGREIGKNEILMKIDRSVIKEMLNIFSNSYLNCLQKIVDKVLTIGVPYIIGINKLDQVLGKFNYKSSQTEVRRKKVVFFKTKLEISQYEINAQLYIIFNN